MLVYQNYNFESIQWSLKSVSLNNKHNIVSGSRKGTKLSRT